MRINWFFLQGIRPSSDWHLLINALIIEDEIYLTAKYLVRTTVRENVQI